MALSGSFCQNFDRTLVLSLDFHDDPWEFIQNIKCLGLEELCARLKTLRLSHPSIFHSLILSMTRRLIHLSDIIFLTIDPSHLLMLL